MVQSGEVPSDKGISQEKTTFLVLSDGTSKIAGDAGGRRTLPFFCILPTDCPYRPPAGQGTCGEGQPRLQEGIRANPLGFSTPTHEQKGP